MAICGPEVSLPRAQTLALDGPVEDLDRYIHQALRLKAAETDQSVSHLVNSAIRESLSEDGIDLEAFDSRASEPSLSFESVVRDLRRSGKL